MSKKTTVYLSDELKAAVEREAQRRRVSEEEVIRQAIASALHRPRPQPGIIEGEPLAEQPEEPLSGLIP